MKLAHIKALITGAAGGIGSTIAQEFVDQGAGVLLTDLRQEGLDDLSGTLSQTSIRVESVAADITSREGRAELGAMAKRSGVNTLINVAGVNPFGLLAEQNAEAAELAMAINVTAPMLLSQALLPFFSSLPAAHIVNVGSMLGSIGMPGYCIYGASKSALRTFSQALRREVADTNVHVHYIAPRATLTSMNNAGVCEMNDRLGMHMDDPSVVARAIVNALVNDRAETYIGLAERAYRIVNAVFPAVIDKAMRRQLPIVREYASKRQVASTPTNEPVQAIHR